jgi:hypothetical protein
VDRSGSSTSVSFPVCPLAARIDKIPTPYFVGRKDAHFVCYCCSQL